jgi:hypothetical protein
VPRSQGTEGRTGRILTSDKDSGEKEPPSQLGFFFPALFRITPKSALLNGIFKFYRAFTIVILVGSIVILIWANIFVDEAQFTELAYNTHPVLTRNFSFNPICTFQCKGVSMVDAIGFAFGAYDAEKSPKSFNNQMKYFFGKDWNRPILYTIHHFYPEKKFGPVLIYQLENITVFEFRGFTSGPELALQIKMIAAQYIFPVMHDLIPFYDLLVDFWLGHAASYFHNVGNSFFDPIPLSHRFLNGILDVYNTLNTTTDVIFIGASVGGLFAKVFPELPCLQRLLHHRIRIPRRRRMVHNKRIQLQWDIYCTRAGLGDKFRVSMGCQADVLDSNTVHEVY